MNFRLEDHNFEETQKRQKTCKVNMTKVSVLNIKQPDRITHTLTVTGEDVQLKILENRAAG